MSYAIGDSGRLGQQSETDYYYPPSNPISLNSDFVPLKIAAGDAHSCTLSADGRVACWGYVWSIDISLFQ